MASATDFPARGKILHVYDDHVVFNPAGTTYEMHLQTSGGRYDGPVGRMIEGLIRISARKVWTVPSGGRFVVPIFGPPRIVQGQAVHVEERMIVLQAGAPIIVDVPQDPDTIDLPRGPIGRGSLVNVTVFSGATFEYLEKAVARE